VGVFPAVNDFGDLDLTNTSEGVLVDYGTGTIHLLGVHSSELSGSNFLFAPGPVISDFGNFNGGFLIL
jgi:hypothetical protein